jgi:uncharacterized protein (TIGR02996 family)
MMTDAHALLRAVCNDPDNIPLRLVYADFLEEQGDPRAEFIRVQCTLAHLDEDDGRRVALRERELALLNQHGRAWLRECELAGRHCDFHNGFVESVVLYAVDSFLDNAKRWFDLTPLRELQLARIDSDLACLALAASPSLARLSRLHLNAVGDTTVSTLCSSSHLGQLRTLELRGQELSLDGVRALLQCTALSRLRDLRLHDCQMGAIELGLFAQQCPFQDLEVLHFNGLPGGDAGWQALANSPRLPRLTTLLVNRGHLTDACGSALAASPFFPALTELRLLSNDLNSGTVTALARSEHRANLRTLDLSFNSLATDGVQALASGLHLRNLRNLSLRACGISGSEVRHLACLPALRRLDLGGNSLGQQGAEELVGSAWSAGLLELHLWDCVLPSASVRILASPHLAGLRVLNLESNFIDDDGLRAFGACPLTHLTTLNLGYCDLTDEAIAILDTLPTLPALCRLGLAGNPLTDRGAHCLAQSPLLERLVLLDLSHTAISSEGIKAILTSPRAQRLHFLGHDLELDDEVGEQLAARFFAQSYLPRFFARTFLQHEAWL